MSTSTDKSKLSFLQGRLIALYLHLYSGNVGSVLRDIAGLRKVYTDNLSAPRLTRAQLRDYMMVAVRCGREFKNALKKLRHYLPSMKIFLEDLDGILDVTYNLCLALVAATYIRFTVSVNEAFISSLYCSA